MCPDGPISHRHSHLPVSRTQLPALSPQTGLKLAPGEVAPLRTAPKIRALTAQFGGAAIGTQSDSMLRSRTLELRQKANEEYHLGCARGQRQHTALSAGGPLFCSGWLGLQHHRNPLGGAEERQRRLPQSRVNSPSVGLLAVTNRLISQRLKTTGGKELINNPLGFFLSWFRSARLSGNRRLE